MLMLGTALLRFMKCKHEQLDIKRARIILRSLLLQGFLLQFAQRQMRDLFTN
jgi:hypothetical protein